MIYWLLSFCDPNLPRGQGRSFLGACIVAVPEHENDVAGAAKAARIAGINPGGECLGMPFVAGFVPPAAYVGRILTREEGQYCADNFHV